jgi:hypothetical protein
MSTYLDGIEGGKHNSDNTECIDTAKTFTVSLSFECVEAKDPLSATKKIIEWLNNVNSMIFDVEDELTGEKFTVDLSEDDQDAVLPVLN